MKIAHICTSTKSGGAANAVLMLHEGLLERGIESSIVEKNTINRSDAVNNKALSQEGINTIEELFIHQNRTEKSNTHFTLDLGGYDLTAQKDILEADIIHLHWVAQFISSKSLLQLASIGKPICWSLRDLRPITGGCHFPAGCHGYETNCSDCPQLIDNYNGLTESALESQREAITVANPTFIAASRWAYECTLRSLPSKEMNVVLIPDGIDCELFNHADKASSRERLNLKLDSRYIVIGAHSFAEKRKGVEFAFQTLEKIRSLPEYQELVSSGLWRIALAGDGLQELDECGWEIDKVGYLDVQGMLDLYSAGDVMLFTSTEDNLPLFLMGACSCSLPVVAFSVGGIPDMITDGVTGFLVELGDIDGMSRRCVELLSNSNVASEMGIASREKIVEQFSIEQQTRSYIELYKKIISEYIPPEIKVSLENFQEGAEIRLGRGLLKLATEYGSLKKEKNQLLRCAEERGNEILLLERACTERLNAIHQLNSMKVILEEKINQLKNTSLVEQICNRIKKTVGLC
jgi:glycosyltransferase involved in cell wall biosynthesis